MIDCVETDFWMGWSTLQRDSGLKWISNGTGTGLSLKMIKSACTMKRLIDFRYSVSAEIRLNYSLNIQRTVKSSCRPYIVSLNSYPTRRIEYLAWVMTNLRILTCFRDGRNDLKGNVFPIGNIYCEGSEFSNI
ncbi:hypothetical protein V1477_021170 [Vespula maculifrons]|uniref:Uncharacterized protein n=1 Tax=Vespula maculifrons TaxID=7453 RepID=A0ABD2AGY7_VESMC